MSKSKTPKSNFNNYEDEDEEYGGDFRAETRQHKREKRVKSALRTRDIDFLSHYEDDED